MSSSLKKFGIALLVLVTFVFIYESGKQKPINWNESFNNRDKNPYGLYILDQEIDALLKTDSLTRFNSSIYEFLEYEDYDTLSPSTLIVIGSAGIDLDQYTADYLKAYIEAGNTALVLYSNPNIAFLEAFGLSKEETAYNDINDTEPNTVLELTNEHLTKQRFRIKNDYYNVNLQILDSTKSNVEVLGYKTVNGATKQVDLVRVKQGKGQLILGTSPIIFTNFYLVESNNHLYVESVFSYLPESQNHYLYVKSLGTLDTPEESSSLLRFIFGNVALKWAWYFFLLGLLVFTLFTAKRRQRIIPIIPPVKNTTIEFTKTVSNLYIQSKDYNDLIHKSIIYSLEKIRRVYYIDTAVLDEKFVHHYQLKTNKNKADILAFVNLVNEFKKTSFLATQEDLVRLHQVTKKILD
ncbi:DUF4350 domain-containing protein [Myroides sp. TSA_177.3]|uniref:DUF4350 domain-containing protein n=1 Tax=Myroides sp. TSA_177.3 TaxID=3415650 RepID=UPI004045939E